MAEITEKNETTTSTEVITEKAPAYDVAITEETEYVTLDDGSQYPVPTKDQWGVLREVADSVPKSGYLVILIEFCERFTYYGLSGPFQNYIQQPPPPSYPAETPGALGRGQQTATALTTFFQFWCYITPIIGAIIADQYLGKYNTIVVFACIYMLGLIILTGSSVPASIDSGGAFPGFIVALVVIGLGTGGIKANVSPLVAEQYTVSKAYVREQPKRNWLGRKTGETERVIVTPQATYQRLFSYFYIGINVGSLSAIFTTLMAKNIGFWSAYLLPTCMFVPGIAVVILGKKWYRQNPPRGSIFLEVFKIIKLSPKYGLEGTKPSVMAKTNPALAEKITWDDVFVDEMRRTFKACIVFCWYPVYWLCYSQMTNNLVSMSATMLTGNVPNDIMQNINPFTLIVTIPIMDRIFYPILRHYGYPMRPMIRITCGFFFAASAMAYCAGIQTHVYNSPPYFDHPNGNGKNHVSAALVIPAYVLVGISEVFASITGLEYAYKKAPAMMKSLVMALFLLTNCFGAVLAFALVSVAEDPKLKWMYTGISAATATCCILFWFCHHKRDAYDVEEDAIHRKKDEMDKYKGIEQEYEPDQEARGEKN
ncbi:POT family-domain-containing protein [Zychaea mexicana]|uniref:POT family-domain-containing protein n=1 Tax=Zychaea mexicana TaxID=64656 RepID=UPI0022FEF0CD|nr:POT family-domain-containing protein [Zychaea mexicana]KAI9493549.1 POT family-domain-containing protein [Zychaea mexicana]